MSASKSETINSTECSAEYINKNYPNTEPCVKCHYFRRLGNGEYFTDKSYYADTGSSLALLPACHYGLDTGKLRQGDNPKDGECPYFKERDRSVLQHKRWIEMC